MQISRLAARFPAKKYRLAKNFRQPQLVKKVFLTSWWPGEQAIHNSQWSFRCARRARLRPSLAYWAYFALLRAQRARFVRPPLGKGSLLESGTTV